MWTMIIGAVTQGESIPSILKDGNTLAWFDYSQVSTITLSGSNITEWRDRLGSANKLAASFGSVQLTADGASFGQGNLASNDLSLGTQFGYYYVVKQRSWTRYRRLYAGLFGSGGVEPNRGTCQQDVSSPRVVMYLGRYLYNNNVDIGRWGVKRDIFNGANSRHNFNEHLVTGNAGSSVSAGGVLLGGTSSQLSDIVIKEFIIRKIVDSVDNENVIYQYLKNKNGL